MMVNNTSLSTRPFQLCLPGKAMLNLGSFDATRVILARKSCCNSYSARSALLGNISAICKALARWPLSSATSSTARRVWRVVRTAMSHARHCGRFISILFQLHLSCILRHAASQIWKPSCWVWFAPLRKTLSMPVLRRGCGAIRLRPLQASCQCRRLIGLYLPPLESGPCRLHGSKLLTTSSLVEP